MNIQYNATLISGTYAVGSRRVPKVPKFQGCEVTGSPRYGTDLSGQVHVRTEAAGGNLGPRVH